MVSHALARDRPQGVEGTREFCERLSPSPPRSLDTFVVAEGNMVVQFGNRELDYPGGSFLDFLRCRLAERSGMSRLPTVSSRAGSPNAGLSATT